MLMPFFENEGAFRNNVFGGTQLSFEKFFFTGNFTEKEPYLFNMLYFFFDQEDHGFFAPLATLMFQNPIFSFKRG